MNKNFNYEVAGPGSSVGCGTASGIQTVAGAILRSGKIFFVEIGHEIISTAILSLPLIQVGQLSVTYKRMGT